MGEKQRENKAVSEADTKKKRKEEKTKKTTKKHSDSVTKDTTTNISATKGKTGRNREGEREKEDKTDKKRKRGSSDDNSSLTSEEAYVDGVNKDENFTGADLENFRISPSTLKRLREKGIAKLFPIQAQTFDPVFDAKDVVGHARTGTGKTLAFALPTVERFLVETGSTEITMDENKQRRTKSARKGTADALHSGGHIESSRQGRKRENPSPFVLVLTPTRELANQVFGEFVRVGADRLPRGCCVLYGGMPMQPQIEALQRGVDIIVGTPGRIVDHIERGNLQLANVSTLILDEADEMLSMGFSDQMDKIFEAVDAEKRASCDETTALQTLLFSATIPRGVKGLISKRLRADHVVVDCVGDEEERERNGTSKTGSGIRHLCIPCPYFNRAPILASIINVYGGLNGKCIVFSEKKSDANDLVQSEELGKDCQALHGDIPQTQREVTLANFRAGRFRALVATDVAARGLDIPEVDVVVQTQPPLDVNSFIHRSGRTARAGKKGVNIVMYTPREESILHYIEKHVGIEFERIGAPQPRQMIAATARQALKGISAIDENVAAVFEEKAKELIELCGSPESALSKALAFATNAGAKTVDGAAALKSKYSLLAGCEDFTTFGIKSTRFAFERNPQVWGLLRKCLPADIGQRCRGMVITKDAHIAVFDVPNDLFDVVYEATMKNDMLYLVEDLPPLPRREVDMREIQRSIDAKKQELRDKRRGGRGGSRGGYHNSFNNAKRQKRW